MKRLTLEQKYAKAIDAYLALSDPEVLAENTGLTDRERRRLWEFLDGEPIVAIALTEGVGKQSVRDAVERALFETERYLTIREPRARFVPPQWRR